MQRRCVMCEREERCIHDLEESENTGAYQEYCPNAEFLVELQFARGGQRMRGCVYRKPHPH
jgi:hypothetical protein